MSRINLTFILSFTMLAGCVDLETSSTEQASHSWGGYHWARTSNPFTLKVGDNVTSQWDGILNTTVSDWSQSTVLDLTKVAGAAKGRCRGTTGRVEVCNNTYGNNGWLGVASISVTGGTHITQGTVKLNDTYMNTPQYNTTAWRNLVSCQEVGHTLGLDHQDENFNNANLGTCMDYTSDPSTNQHPNKHDYDELITIYSHTDSTTTVGQLTTNGNAAGESPAEWGHLISSSHNGMLETYERDHGNGDLTITFVTWAQ
ncbi:MAG TPA: hypothetical protein VIV40_30925 [Kofleriaceae bacterium]